MKSRAEVAGPQSAPGALVMLMSGGRGPPAGARLLCGASSVTGLGGWSSARPALIYTFPALPLSLLGPGKRVVTFAVNNEFSQVPHISPLLQPPPRFPGGAGLLQSPWGAGRRARRGPGHRVPGPARPIGPSRVLKGQHWGKSRPQAPQGQHCSWDVGLRELSCALLPSPEEPFCGSHPGAAPSCAWYCVRDLARASVSSSVKRAIPAGGPRVGGRRYRCERAHPFEGSQNV